MADYTFRVERRRTSLTAEEITALGVTTENTIVDVTVIQRDPLSGVGVLAEFQLAYVRQSTNKRQLAALIRARAKTAIDVALLDALPAGGEATMVGAEFPV